MAVPSERMPAVRQATRHRFIDRSDHQGEWGAARPGSLPSYGGMTMPAEIDAFTTAALGDSSYLVLAGSDAALVDPQRDAWRFLATTAPRGLTVRYVLETHVHNDYISGALEVRAATGAEVIAPARGRYEFPHRPVGEGDEIKLGGISLRALETPGHTPEHLSYLMLEADRPVAVFTGGSLMQGSAGRTDLLGSGRAEALARAQYRSLRRLAELPGATRVLATHGAGSFCASAPRSNERITTIGRERDANPALLAPDEDAFVRRQLDGLLDFPAYYRHMAGLNRAGPAVLERLPSLDPLTADEVAAHAAAGGWVVDARDRRAFAAGHLPGSLNVELNEQFAVYVGWIVPFGAPLVLVLPEPAGRSGAAAVTQLVRIGYERVGGWLAGGVDAWAGAGRPLRDYPIVGIDELGEAGERGAVVLDVRQEPEWREGAVPGSLRCFVGDLPWALHELPGETELWTVCASGQRASVAASLLDGAGIPVRLVADGGVPDWLARRGDRAGRRTTTGRACSAPSRARTGR
jgi:glyoxylase-like metal-dependent hydrolase (beta-lactamase superfamily II)/rhodanese-related sulfurtransferase